MVVQAVSGFKFTPIGIGGIFKTYTLKVPLYQREYSWEKEQINQLFVDLNRAKSEHTDHFLGTIVTINIGKSESLQIVDGQQRLTTTAIFITAIREMQKRLGGSPQIIESINNDYLSSFNRKLDRRMPKLVLNIDDNEYFSKLIDMEQVATTRESHERLAQAYRIADSYLKTLMSPYQKEDRPSALNDWLDFIEHRASVILVETDNSSRAFKMFETLNDRGLRTSQADLVKSYLFGESRNRIEEAQARWSSMKDKLEEISDDDRAINFLRHNIIATKGFVRAEEVYDKVQSSVRGEHSSLTFLNTLAVNARVYVATFQPSADHWSEFGSATTRGITVFNYFNLKPFRPLLLSLALKFSPVEFRKSILSLVSISVRLVIASMTRSGTIEQTVATAALSVYNEEITTSRDLKLALKNVIINDADFQQEFAVARVSKPDLARYYLRALEHANANQQEPWYIENDDPAAITLEHILPQNATRGWSHIDKETQHRYVKRLGNMCLLTKSGNEMLGNNPFSEKREHYINSPYLLTSKTADFSSWTPEVIDTRQQELALLALKAWPI